MHHKLCVMPDIVKFLKDILKALNHDVLPVHT
jgi:hypothetical protein